MIYQLLVWVFAAVTITSVPNPRPTGWVTDQAKVLDADTEASLNAVAESLYAVRKVELAIVVVDDVKGTPKQFATDLFNHWKIGNATTDSGVLVLLVMSKRRLEIETGTGMEGALPAQWLADMQVEKMVPRFKQKDFGGGLSAGVAEISKHLMAAPTESVIEQKPGEYRDNGVVTETGSAVAPLISPPPPEPAYLSPLPDDEGGVSKEKLAAGGAGAAGLGGVSAALYAWRRKRNRTCSKCQPERPMLPLSEVEDDKHLDPGQRKEEALGSVNYEVVICPGCQDARTLRHGKWFSSYDRCGKCSYKTLRSLSSTIVSATYDHGGQVRVTENCQNCRHSRAYVRHTSKLTRPSTTSSARSSSSSRGSFGGGSSRGGGAGSSW